MPGPQDNLLTGTFMTAPADLDAVRAAARRIAELAHRTPVMTCATLDRLAGRALFFKRER
jgi:threonine dehydratase